ncbi:MAG: 4'-phosphopantetheinyl transferase superfamily protein [Candidatus Eremiobacteraeota bacterium]|nr:4'-phosphopantetheinyl transferase superfamily protein [Candidatus Eremiobacteraeota bacterium]
MPNDDVWHLRLDRGDPAVPQGTLSERERLRALEFHRPADRERYVRGREGLRAILNGYLHRGVSPSGVEIGENPAGKPKVAGLEFSVTHAGDDYLCAVAGDIPVGIDVEPLGDLRDLEGLVAACCTAPERIFVENAPAVARSREFSRLWVRKEAVLKAAGCGLGTIAPHEIDVLEPRARLGGLEWDLHDVGLTGFACAVALEHRRSASRTLVPITVRPISYHLQRFAS